MSTVTAEQIRAARAELARRSLAEFVKQAWTVLEPATPLIWGWHLDAICEHLEAVSDGRIKRLSICVPPGSMKSLLVAVFWQAWEWISRPHLRTVTASHSLSFASRDNIRARRLITSDWYQSNWSIRLQDDVNTTLKFENESTGYRWAVPYSKLTGARGDRLIIDDPIAVGDAASEIERQKVNDLFFQSATSRLNNPKRDPIVIIMQRIHADDLVGAILAKGLGYETLIIPMEWEGESGSTSIGWSDPRTEIGALMLPEQRGPEEVDELRRADAYAYAAQYQQDPVPKSSGFFDPAWFKRWTPATLPSNLAHYMTSDHSLGLSGKSDFNVIRVWGVDDRKNIYLLDSFRERCHLKEALGIATDPSGKLKVADRGALALAKKWKPRVWFAEPDNNFKASVDVLRDTMLASGVMVRIEYASNHGKDKATKASAYQVMAQAGKVYLPMGSVGDTALQEYQAFPKGKDDQVDADAIIARELQGAHRAMIWDHEPERRPIDGYDRRASVKKDRQAGFY
ncbi:hypothetical protein [Flavisphingomonas formosensis]|uniref:hypothetical protein n=1 Tax=Flavisphingomonas formosensis TaxID=861534 RepID=UPI0012FC7087|nr:hypothetical protein [Sphingomonas formosensis]